MRAALNRLTVSSISDAGVSDVVATVLERKGEEKKKVVKERAEQRREKMTK